MHGNEKENAEKAALLTTHTITGHQPVWDQAILALKTGISSMIGIFCKILVYNHAAEATIYFDRVFQRTGSLSIYYSCLVVLMTSIGA